GADFGEGGEGWLRISLCLNEAILSEALKRLSEHSKIWQRKFRPEE
ncbi:MAG TPA: LL-diaminopimelate aminotransferase, partial [candidate division Zixibacteria bacterium]|nr:LL-diaminopimelate aminotransferase [candidate division Zixibacteria bacterium]